MRLKVPLALLAIVPVAPLLDRFVGAPMAVFATGAIAIAILADWVRRSTEQLAHRLGPAVGGLLNVSFGSLAELILAFFVLRDGHVDIVRAQITGSIIGTGLFGLGVAIVVGAVGRPSLHFDRAKAGPLGSLLILVVIALLLPAVFDTARRTSGSPATAITEEHLSIGVSVVLLTVYAANLVYTLVTRRDVFADEAAGEAAADADRPRAWPTWLAIAVLVVVTALIAGEAEFVSGALEATARSAGLSPVFIGVVVLALVGTASDLVAAAFFARQGKGGLVMNICVGSSIQVALVVAPVLVIGSWAIGQPMSLVFRPLDLFAIAGTALVVNSIASDGELTWFEGVLLIGVYVLLALAFYFSSPVGA